MLDLPGPAGMTAYGFFVGLAASLMGISGGSISNMILTLHGKSMHNAVATSAGLGVPITIVGMIGYALAGLPQQAAQTIDVTKAKPFVEFGVSGLLRTRGVGYIYEEFLRDLSTARGEMTLRQMTLGEYLAAAIVAALLYANRSRKPKDD